jgi:hypothetical protein
MAGRPPLRRPVEGFRAPLQRVGPRCKQEFHNGRMAPVGCMQEGGRMPCPGVGPGFEEELDPLKVPIPGSVGEGPIRNCGHENGVQLKDPSSWKRKISQERAKKTS